MAKTRIPAAALVLVLVVALATPSSADSLEQRRRAAQAKRAEAARQLDTLRADDRQLESALRDLDASLASQAAATQAAQQAERAAQAAVGSAEAKLKATEGRMSNLRAQAAALAVRAYVHPGGDSLLEMVRSRDLGEASRRETLLAHVASTDRDVLSQLRATREDQESDQERLRKLREQAEARRRAASTRLAELARARADQARIQGALDARIAAYVSDLEGLAREEGKIQELIRARSQPPPVAVVPAPQQQQQRGSVGNAPRAASSGGLIWPASGPVNSPFGPRWGRMHTGIDIGAPSGSAIRAAKGGTVISAGYNGGYGLAVVIDHGGGLTTLYGHCSSISVGDGASVSQGQTIGAVGCTGSCTGPHLHFETRVGGTPQNPMNYLP
ncbi:MAG TPA: peptidoglycan DD-metalloendopeptidase family protein [Acidimicrobiales bacterium]|nr:peptidoglycan DD-metalloendopeptidase family protein [Acidimicrobiales bacterium]